MPKISIGWKEFDRMALLQKETALIKSKVWRVKAKAAGSIYDEYAAVEERLDSVEDIFETAPNAEDE